MNFYKNTFRNLALSGLSLFLSVASTSASSLNFHNYFVYQTADILDRSYITAEVNSFEYPISVLSMNLYLQTIHDENSTSSQRNMALINLVNPHRILFDNFYIHQFGEETSRLDYALHGLNYIVTGINIRNTFNEALASNVVESKEDLITVSKLADELHNIIVNMNTIDLHLKHQTYDYSCTEDFCPDFTTQSKIMRLGVWAGTIGLAAHPEFSLSEKQGIIAAGMTLDKLFFEGYGKFIDHMKH